jgi:hypothetical protein
MKFKKAKVEADELMDYLSDEQNDYRKYLWNTKEFPVRVDDLNHAIIYCFMISKSTRWLSDAERQVKVTRTKWQQYFNISLSKIIDKKINKLKVELLLDNKKKRDVWNLRKKYNDDRI